MADSSFDIVSKVDRQEADNALNQARKELTIARGAGRTAWTGLTPAGWRRRSGSSRRRMAAAIPRVDVELPSTGTRMRLNMEGLSNEVYAGVAEGCAGRLRRGCRPGNVSILWRSLAIMAPPREFRLAPFCGNRRTCYKSLLS